MPRQPKFRKKKIGGNTYWFTEAGGAATYFGNADEVSYEDARRAFSTHVGTLADEGKDRKRAGQSAGELMDVYLARMQQNRSRVELGDEAPLPGPASPAHVPAVLGRRVDGLAHAAPRRGRPAH